MNDFATEYYIVTKIQSHLVVGFICVSKNRHMPMKH
ncbi:hypothetical protein M2143_001887 [Lachnospiraceae bacterium PFB1-17]